MLPAADEIAWPTEKGDVEAVADALAVLSARLPAIKAAFRRHRRELRAAASPNPPTLAAPVS